jgi:alpha-galactosidase
MLAAPLFAGTDVRSMNASIGSILVNREVIAVDQDPLGRSGERVLGLDWVDLWVRPLANGDRAVLVLNRLVRPTRYVVDPASIFGANAVAWGVRDLWAHRTSSVSQPFTITVPGHGAAFLRITPS